MRRCRLGDNYLCLTKRDNYAHLTKSDNSQNFIQPIDILSPFVYYPLKVLAGSGSGEPSLNWQQEQSRFGDPGIPKVEAGDPKRPAPMFS
jgi:hypothetical protein